MNYDFNDNATLRKIDDLLKKDITELNNEELNLVIEYKADVKSKNLAATEYLEKLSNIADKEIEYSRKLSELAQREFEIKQKEAEIRAKIAESDTE